MGGQSGEPLGWIIIWGTTANKIKIRIQANFIAGIFSLLEQEVEPSGGRERSLERNWFPANGEETACCSTFTVIPTVVREDLRSFPSAGCADTASCAPD